MKHTELNAELVGARVKGIFMTHVTGTIVAVFAEKNGVRCDLNDPNANCKGVEIELDGCVYDGDNKFTRYESTERIMPQDRYNSFVERHGKEYADKVKASVENGFGNLKYTEVIGSLA